MTAVGELVKVATAGPLVDGIVFDTPSAAKVVVAVIDPGRGPVFRTVHPQTLSERESESVVDRSLRQLIRRTPPPTGRAARGGSAARGGHTGHTRGAVHRTSDH